MKHKCPYCGEKKISTWDRFMASDLNPAICPECKKPSAQSKGLRAAEAIYSTIGLPLTILAALFQQVWWPIALFFAIWLIYGVTTFLYLPMVAVNESAVQRKYYFILGALVVTLVWLLIDTL